MNTHDLGGWSPRLPDNVPSEIASWLAEPGSLTQRVQALCSPDALFNLRVLHHDLAWPHDDEAALLKANGKVRRREVLLCRGETPLIFAHSVVAFEDVTSETGAWASMDGIGNQSLGTVLFSDPAVVRGMLRFHPCREPHPLYLKAAPWCASPPGPPPELWARRALYLRDDRELLVSEVFLPALYSG